MKLALTFQGKNKTLERNGRLTHDKKYLLVDYDYQRRKIKLPNNQKYVHMLKSRWSMGTRGTGVAEDK